MTYPLITLLRQLQAPLLAAILLGACVAKLVQVLRARSVDAVTDATALFPSRLRLPVTMVLCATELALGVGLCLTASGRGEAPDWVRLTTTLLFLVAMSALLELRERRPDLGCGCFGGFSGRPVGHRSIIRAAVLAGAAVASVGAPGLDPPPPGPKALAELGIVIAELLVLAALSPEVGHVLVRLGYSEPCESREFPAQRAVTSLYRSRAWRRHAAFVTTDEPSDMWRELCWWYLVYAGQTESHEVDVVFAVEVARRRSAIRAVVVHPWAAPAVPRVERPGAGPGLAQADFLPR